VRRLALFILLPVFTGCERFPATPRGIPVQLVTTAGATGHLPAELAESLGFYRQEGLNVTITRMSSSAKVVQSLIAIGSGGPNGLGFAQGKQKMMFLPFAHSDFIFAVIGEELGLIGTLTVLLIFALFLWRGIRISLLAPDRFGMLLSLGLVTAIVAQALFNISVVLSLVPTKGIPLPFISYGGSSLVPTLAAVGILLNISQHATGSLSLPALKSGHAVADKKARKLHVAPARRVASSRFG